jgi:hypothetical protein
MNVVSLNNVSLDGNVIRKGASGGGGGVSLMTEVTWQELKDLRDNGQLTAGHKYRMIDYDTYTSQVGTQSAMHPFDLILTALDNKTLSEECSAIQSARDVDGYFANSNLGAWRVWYCLDNDTLRFIWATPKGIICSPEPGTSFSLPYFGDFEWEGRTYTAYMVDIGKAMGTEQYIPAYALFPSTPNAGDIPTYVLLDGTAFGEEGLIDQTAEMGQMWVVSSVSEVDGKGVIYRLVDEYNNDICYDFKNILISGNYTFYDYKGEAADYSLTNNVANNTILPMTGLMKTLPCIKIHRHSGGTNTIYGNVFSFSTNVVFELGDGTQFLCNEIRNCVDLLMKRTDWRQGAEYSIYENLTGEIVQNNKIYNADIKGINGGDLDSITTKKDVYTHIRQKADGTIYSYTDEDIYNAISATKTE